MENHNCQYPRYCQGCAVSDILASAEPQTIIVTYRDGSTVMIGDVDPRSVSMEGEGKSATLTMETVHPVFIKHVPASLVAYWEVA